MLIKYRKFILFAIMLHSMYLIGSNETENPGMQKVVCDSCNNPVASKLYDTCIQSHVSCQHCTLTAHYIRKRCVGLSPNLEEDESFSEYSTCLTCNIKSECAYCHELFDHNQGLRLRCNLLFLCQDCISLYIAENEKAKKIKLLKKRFTRTFYLIAAISFILKILVFYDKPPLDNV